MTFAAACLLVLAAGRVAAMGPEPAPQEPQVKVEIAEGSIRVAVDFVIDAPLDAVWAVLTDFEHMPRFISNLRESRVLERTPDRVHVVQKGVASFGPITFAFESERAIRLHPKDRIQATLLRGNLKRYTGDTRLHADGPGTRIAFRSEAATDVFIPPYFGRRLIENETREQYLEIAAEIARRKTASPPAEPQPSAPKPPEAPRVDGSPPDTATAAPPPGKP